MNQTVDDIVQALDAIWRWLRPASLKVVKGCDSNLNDEESTFCLSLFFDSLAQGDSRYGKASKDAQKVGLTLCENVL